MRAARRPHAEPAPLATVMLIIFWNIQRTGRSAAQRWDNVLEYINTCLARLQPDILFLCEVAPSLFGDLGKLAGRDYACATFEHHQAARQEYFDALSSERQQKVGPKLFSESVCSFFVFWRKTSFFDAGFGLLTRDANECRFFYHKTVKIRRHFQVEDMVTIEEGRPLVLFRAGIFVFGVCHLVSGAPAVASKQLSDFRGILKTLGGAGLIGDMNIPFAALNSSRAQGFTAHNPGYITQKSGSTLDYLWSNDALPYVVSVVPMDEELLNLYFINQDPEARYSDHAPVGYQLASFFSKPRDVTFPWPPRRMSTRASKRAMVSSPGSSSSSSSSSPLGGSGSGSGSLGLSGSFGSFGKLPSMQTDIMRYVYVKTGPQQLTLAQRGRHEIPIDPNGDCLFASLIAMGASTLMGAPFISIQVMRNYVATRILELDEELDLGRYHLTTMEVVNEVRTLGRFAGLIGDLTPWLVARALEIDIDVLQPDGSVRTMNGGARGTFLLIRFQPHGAPEHFHATR